MRDGKTAAARAFFLALLLGMAWLAVMSPLSIPDEEYHYRVSYCLSNYLLGQWDAPTLGYERYFDFTSLRGHYNVPEGYTRLFGEILPTAPRGKLIPVLEGIPRVYLPMYLPQTLGLALGRALDLGFGGVFLLGRLGNLAFYALCLALAVRLAPAYKSALLTAGLLPMALHQAASFSYDPFLNGMALIFFAALLRCMTGQGPMTKKEYGCLLVSAALLAPAKGACVPLLFLVWRISAARFSSPGDRRRRLWGLLGVCALTMALFFLPTVSRQMGGALNWEGERNYTLAFALGHPLRVAGIFERTLRREGPHWLRCMAGQSLAGLTLSLPKWISTALLLLLPLAGTPEGMPPDAKTRAAFAAAAAGMVLLSMTVMFFTWTSDTRDVIQGVQGRYFLSAAAPLSVALSPPKRWKHENAALLVLLLMCHGAALLHVLRYTFA